MENNKQSNHFKNSGFLPSLTSSQLSSLTESKGVTYCRKERSSKNWTIFSWSWRKFGFNSTLKVKYVPSSPTLMFTLTCSVCTKSSSCLLTAVEGASLKGHCSSFLSCFINFCPSVSSSYCKSYIYCWVESYFKYLETSKFLYLHCWKHTHAHTHTLTHTHALFFLTLASHPYTDKSLNPHHCRVTAVLATFLLPGESVIVISSLEQHQDHSINWLSGDIWRTEQLEL